MADSLNKLLAQGKRVIADLPGNPGNVVFVCIAGLHGNEHSTVRALAGVVDELQERSLKLHGRFVALLGNVNALRKGLRYVDEDLNRCWNAEHTDQMEAGGTEQQRLVEEHERAELFEVFDPLFKEFPERGFYLDLHTSSAEGPPFCLCWDRHTRSSEFLRALSIPRVSRVVAQNSGKSLLGYAARRGFVAVAVEGGRHESSEAISYLQAALWVSLFEAGVLKREEADDLQRSSDELLRNATAGLPTQLEVVYHHFISPEDRFCMLPGLRSFQQVHKGQQIATDRNGPLCAPEDGRILLPLYQLDGSDGYLLARECGQ